MARRVLFLVLACGLALGSVACQKVPVSWEDRGLTFIEAVPADVGTLVGVTMDAPGWANLWYQKADKSIVMIAVNTYEGRINGDIVRLPRE